MKYFSSSVEFVYTLRTKEDCYLSDVQAAKLAVRLASLFEDDSPSCKAEIASLLSRGVYSFGGSPYEESSRYLTPSEERVVRGLMAWFAAPGGALAPRAFTVSNLNCGYSLVVLRKN